MSDAVKNFYTTLVASGSVIGSSSGTSLTVSGGDGANAATAPFNITVWPSGVQPTRSNAEILRVTAIATDTFTVTRAQEGTTALSGITSGYQVQLGSTAKTITDLAGQRTATATIGPAGSFADYICTGTADNVQINAAVAAVNAAGGGLVLIRQGTYNLAANVSLKNISYVTIRGEGMEQTILKGAGLSKNDLATTNSITIEDLTIDVNNVAGFNCINLNGNSYNFRLSRLYLKNSNNVFALNWSTVDALVVEDCIILDGGLTVGSDNAAGGQMLTTNNATIFNNNILIKQNSVGGGLITTGQTGNVIIQGNSMVDISGNCYAAVSIENQTGNSKSVKVVNNYCYRVGIEFGVSANSNRLGYGQIIGNFVDGGGVAASPVGYIKADKTDVAVVSNNIIANGEYGYYLTNCGTVIANNNIALNTNAGSAASPTDKGGFYINGNTNTVLSDNFVYDSSGTTPYGVVIVGGTGRVYLNNNKFEGPFVTNSILTSGTQSYLSLKGNRFNGTTSFGTVTTANYSDNDGLNPNVSFAQGNVTGATTFTRANGQHITATLIGNITVTLTSGKMASDVLTLELTQDGTGSRTATWPANFKKTGGTLTLSTATNAVDVIKMAWDGTNWLEISRALNVS